MPRNILSKGLPNNRRHGNTGIEFMGDWNKLNQLVSNQSILISSAAIQGQLNFSKIYKRELRRNIMNGGTKFGYPPLSQSYLKRKQKYAKSRKKFIFTFSLYNSISIITKKLKYISVGVPKGLYKQESNGVSNDLPIDQYAMIGEMGSGNQPKRPIFTDTYHDIGGKDNLRKQIVIQLAKVYTLFGIKP